MLRSLLIALLTIHGLIHVLGLVKAYEWAEVAALRQPIERPTGLCWGAAAGLFLTAGALVLRHHDRWWLFAAVAIVLSQALIFRHWQDARFGTIANGLLAIAVVAGVGVWMFRRDYILDAARTIERTRTLPAQRIGEGDLLPLPVPVQRFLRQAGVVGTNRPRSMRLEMAGEIRSEDGPWMPFTTVQVNSFDVPARFFWMDATAKGLPTKGLHAYEDGTATMRIKVLGLMTVLEAGGPELDTAETVTWLNDLCLFAPGALLDPRLRWVALDDRSAQATFTHRSITVSAVLVFDAADRLVDFVSQDRYLVAPPEPPTRRTFRTPARDHHQAAGILVPGFGEAVWELPGGSFTYGRFRLQSLEYDVQ